MDEGDGPDSDIVLVSRIRLARNFKRYQFSLCKTRKKLDRFMNYLKEVYKQNGRTFWGV